MNEWYVWGGLGLVLAGAVWFYLGNKAGIAVAVAIALEALRRKIKSDGISEERERNERDAWDAISKANDARNGSYTDSSSGKLYEDDGHRRD